jgi:class 3 adenylate cyclase
MQQQVKFCKTGDGTRIAYAVVGEGPPLVIASPWVSHLQFEWDHPNPRRFFQSLAEHHRLIRYDKRGTGLSDWTTENLDVETRISDLGTVVDAAGLDTFTLMGFSESGPAVLAYAARNPERVSSLILYGSFHRNPVPLPMVEAVIGLVKANWGAGSAALTAVFVPSVEPVQAAWFSDLQRVSTSGESAAAILAANTGFDVTPELAAIRAPTLVLHRRGDQVIPLDIGREMAALIPRATFRTLEGDVHLPMFGDMDSVLEAIGEFLGDSMERMPERHMGAFRTVLFTDLVGHTEMMSRLGDERGRAVLREHEDITRNVLKQHGGTEVKTMGDGFMASFGSVTKAVECAIALQRAFAEREGEPLSVRVGLNAGEPIEEDGDLFGATVILASRIAAKADAGEILVADTVRGLCSGKGFLFADRGKFVAKGFEEPVRVYEVSWRG